VVRCKHKCDATANYSQALVHHFVKWLFIPQNVFQEDREHYHVKTHYGCYKYYKDNDRLQRPEKCPYWTGDASEIVPKEVTKLLDYTQSLVKSTR
jgi:hypothetical protein